MSQQSTRATIAITCVLLPAVLVGAFTLLFGGNTRGASAAPAQGPLAAPGGVAVRWGFYITYNPNSLQSLQANARYLTHVSPWFYSLNASAQVMGNDQANVSQIIRSAGAKNLPMLKNTGAEYDIFTGIMSDTNKVNSIVDQIDTLITANNYDGITIDFEALNPQDKTRLTIFMSRLYDRLHPKGKLVVAVVAPKTRDINTGWAAAYDYPALGRVVDYVLIMAYDYAWVNGDPGPIAPMPKLRETAAYALARIAPEQIIWGTGVYGYDWVVGPDGKSLTRAESRTWAEADALSRQPGAQSGYDSAAFSPWVRYSQNGQPRVVWYEDKRSFQGKIELITNRSIGGFALWRLGQEDPAIWPVIASVPTPVPVTPTRSAFPTKPGPSTPYVPPTSTSALPTSTPTPTPKPLACNIIAHFSSTQDKLYFPETGHSLGGAFLKYWRANGGLPIFGFPLSEEFTEKSPTDGKTYTVQYFERNRFEYHPENQPPNDVLLGLLGTEALGTRIFPPSQDPAPGPDTVYFPQVGHTLNGAFLRYWQKYGGIRQFGYPMTEPMLEKSPTDGKTYTVQYMERARFELHPEYAGTNAEVLLGLLGLNVSPCR